MTVTRCHVSQQKCHIPQQTCASSATSKTPWG